MWIRDLLVEIFGEDIRESFEAFFPKSAKVKFAAGSWSDFLDSRPKHEILAALELIPPFILGNSDNTYKGDAPVKLKRGVDQGGRDGPLVTPMQIQWEYIEAKLREMGFTSETVAAAAAGEPLPLRSPRSAASRTTG